MNTQTAYDIAAMYMEKHGLFVRGWRFDWDNAVRRFGCCYCGQKRITLSKPLTECNDSAEVTDVILHEIAHALCPSDVHHGWQWKAMARKIGARPERCYSSNDVNMISNKWRGTCPSCHDTKEITRLRKPDFMVCKCWYTAQAAYKANPNPKVGINFSNHEYRWSPLGRVIIPAKKKQIPPAPVVPPGHVLVSTLHVQAASACTATAPAQWVNLGKVTDLLITPKIPTTPMFDAAKAVAMYQAGSKVVDIAVAMGYERGQGQNRTRTALIKAGVYKQ